jgi:hypothetical protein
MPCVGEWNLHVYHYDIFANFFWWCRTILQWCRMIIQDLYACSGCSYFKEFRIKDMNSSIQGRLRQLPFFGEINTFSHTLVLVLESLCLSDPHFEYSLVSKTSLRLIIKFLDVKNPITLLNDGGPHNRTITCWELNLNLNLPAQLFEHPIAIIWTPR